MKGLHGSRPNTAHLLSDFNFQRKNMKYLFESKKALDMYYELIKELGVDAEPNEQNDCVYITEKFMSECFEVYLSKYTS